MKMTDSVEQGNVGAVEREELPETFRHTSSLMKLSPSPAGILRKLIRQSEIYLGALEEMQRTQHFDRHAVVLERQRVAVLSRLSALRQSLRRMG